MKIKHIVCYAILLLSSNLSFSQIKDELQTQKNEYQSEADKAQAKADSIQAIIDALPGWRSGAFGTIGGSISGFNNWYAQGVPNNNSGTIGFTMNAYANKIEEKYFWRNALAINLNWVKLDNTDIDTDDSDFNATTDVFNLSSLYGWKLSNKIAASAMAEYRTTLIDNFNDPGYLDAGIGGTWTPAQNLIVTVLPLNYNFVFSSGDTVFESSLGAKIVADYTRKIKAINFKTNLSLFQSYEDNNLSSWTWTNSFSYTLWKMIGVGFDFGLRSNRQEAANFQNTTLENADNDLQSFYTVGLSYSF